MQTAFPFLVVPAIVGHLAPRPPRHQMLHHGNPGHRIPCTLPLDLLESYTGLLFFLLEEFVLSPKLPECRPLQTPLLSKSPFLRLYRSGQLILLWRTSRARCREGRGHLVRCQNYCGTLALFRIALVSRLGRPPSLC